MINRQSQILEIVTRENKIEVVRLAEILGFSQVTIRTDLDIMEEKGLIKREHGYAIISSSDDINNRLAYHYERKQELARFAARQISDGETVMIESGSCCALLAAELVTTKQNITIITNSAFIAGYIRKNPYAKIILLGGEYQNESQVMVGPIVSHCVKNFTVDKLFIGTDGFNEKTGFTGNDFARADTVQNMAMQASHVCVITESHKFSQQGVVSLMPLSEISMVITDSLIPEDKKTFLTDRHLYAPIVVLNKSRLGAMV